MLSLFPVLCFFFQAEDGIRDLIVTGVQTCALPIYLVKTTIAIISICLLVGFFAVSQISRPTLRSEITEALSQASAAKISVATYWSENSKLPNNDEDASFEYVDRKSTRLNSSHDQISYAVFCLKKKKKKKSAKQLQTNNQ